jgi:hypothetical protein
MDGHSRFCDCDTCHEAQIFDPRILAQIQNWADLAHPSQVHLNTGDHIWRHHVRLMLRQGASLGAAVTLANEAVPARGN